MATTPDLYQVAETLVDNGATYVAAIAPTLVDEPAQLYYHLPASTSHDQQGTVAKYLKEEVGFRPYEDQIGGVRIADETLQVCVSHVQEGGLHSFRRVLVYSDEHVVGLDPVEIEDGVATVSEIVKTQPSFDPPSWKEVRLLDLVEDLAEAGATSVEISHKGLIVGTPSVDLRIPMVPAVGQPIVGPVDFVQVIDEVYPLHTTLTLNGPYGSGSGWTALYVSDNVSGLEPVSVEEGCEAGRDLLNRADEADSIRELGTSINR